MAREESGDDDRELKGGDETVRRVGEGCHQERVLDGEKPKVWGRRMGVGVRRGGVGEREKGRASAVHRLLRSCPLTPDLDSLPRKKGQGDM